MSVNLYSGLTTAQIIAQGVSIQMPITSSGTTYDSLGGGSGAGDVTGPASSTDTALVRFNGATGKIVQDSALTLNSSGNVSGTAVGVYATNDVSIQGGAAGGAGKVYITSNGGFIQTITPAVVPANPSATDLGAGNNQYATVWADTGGMTTLRPISSGTGFVGTTAVPYASGTINNLTVTNINGSAYPPSSGGIGKPASTTSSGIAIWSGTAGAGLLDTGFTISATTLGVPNNGKVEPLASGTVNLGSAALPFATVNADAMQLNNTKVPTPTWVHFSGAAGGITVYASANIKSAVRTAQGNYTFYFTKPFLSGTSYGVVYGYSDRSGMAGVGSASCLGYPQGGTAPSGQGFSIITGGLTAINAYSTLDTTDCTVAWVGN